jgi:hypothetical protein
MNPLPTVEHTNPPRAWVRPVWPFLYFFQPATLRAGGPSGPKHRSPQGTALVHKADVRLVGAGWQDAECQ